jgi:hypothetical protein
VSGPERGGSRANVTVVFINGNVVNFAAQQFDVNLGSGSQALNKYPYKDDEG